MSKQVFKNDTEQVVACLKLEQDVELSEEHSSILNLHYTYKVAQMILEN